MEFYISINRELYTNKDGRWYKVLSVVTNDEDANIFMKRHKNSGVLGSLGKISVICDKSDKGEPEI